MKGTLRTTIGLCLLAGMGVAITMGSPVINGAVVNLGVFNDNPTSTRTVSNLYPTSLSIQDENVTGGGWANRHNFRLSDNGGIGEAVFMNADPFAFAADVTMTSDGAIEGGLNVSPWWSKEVDGVFMINGTSGEIACFGGRLPFFSFTASNGLHYTKGTTVRMEVVYDPHSLTQADPATIQYHYTVGGTTFTSGPLAFDEGNGAEGYGTWGMLDDARVGGYVQLVNPTTLGRIEFSNMVYTPEPAGLALLGLGLALLRRR